MFRKPIVRIVAILIAIGFLGFLCYGMFAPAINNVFNNIFTEAVDAGDRFVLALKTGEYEEAFDLLAPEYRQHIDTPAKLAEAFPVGSLEAWSYETYAGETYDGRAAVILDGPLSLAGGQQLGMKITMLSIENEWLVASIFLYPVE